MEPMTPEERFTIIENLMKTAAEFHARHEEWLARHEEWFARHEESSARNEAETAKNTAAIRDLIVISRTLVDSQKEATSLFEAHAAKHVSGMDQMRAGMNELRAVQQATEEKLH